MFLFYIAVGITQIFLGGATDGDGIAARLASMAQHEPEVRLNLVLGLLLCFVALTLGVALYAITREQEPDLALLALICRVGEGLLGSIYIPLTLGLLSLVNATGASVPDAAATQTLGSFLQAAESWSPALSATFFAVGSTLFCWLLIRGRLIPVALAWFGLLASILLVVGLPLQIAGILRGSLVQFMWLPMALFEIPAGLWLLIKGVPTPVPNVALSSAN
jgi:hypothetical protein